MMLDNIFQYMTLNETIELMQSMAIKMPRSQDKKYNIGLYIETKQYKMYRDQYNVDLAEKLHQNLQWYDLETVEKSTGTIPVIIESFEREALEKYQTLSDLPRIYLMFDKMMEDESLTDVAKFAHGIGPSVDGIFKNDFLAVAKSNELQVHPYVVRDETLEYTQNPIDENVLYYTSGVDGIFTEHPHLTKAAFLDYNKTVDEPKKEFTQ